MNARKRYLDLVAAMDAADRQEEILDDLISFLKSIPDGEAQDEEPQTTRELEKTLAEHREECEAEERRCPYEAKLEEKIEENKQADKADVIGSTSPRVSRKQAELKALILKKRPDIATAKQLIDSGSGDDEMSVEQIVNDILKFPDSKSRKAALNWFIKGAIRLPEDAPKVTEALSYATRAKGKANTDALSYGSPMAMIEALHEFKPKAKPINPDKVPELSDKREMGNGVVTYLVQDDREGQQAMRQIINTHWGEDANPWCLLHGDGKGGLSDGTNGGYNAWEYWNHYNALPKRVAFKDGKLLAFMATDKSPDGRTIDDVKERYDEVVNELKRGLYEDYGFYSKEYQRIEEINEVIENIEEYGDKEEIYKAINFVGEDLKKRIESIDDEDTKSIESITAEVIESLKDSITRQEESWYEWVEENVELVEQDGVYFILDPEGDRVGLWVDDHGNAVDEFDSKANGEEQWWDRQDSSHEGIPLGNMAVPNDPFGRWADFEIRDGELKQIGGYRKGEPGEKGYVSWNDKGFKNEEQKEGGSYSWYENGELAHFSLNDSVEVTFRLNGKILASKGISDSEAMRIYAENDQRKKGNAV